jgi:DNA-directed RNA polymerase beta subunit
MIIAREKKKENIIEYLLYMFQIENALRALGLDEERIMHDLVAQYEQPAEVMAEIRDWYHHLLRMMKEEHRQEKGHLQFLKNQMNDLYAAHKRMLSDPDEAVYATVFREAMPDLEVLRKKINHPEAHEVEIALEGVYAFLLLNMQKEKISEDTKEAVDRITRWLFLLGKKYKELEKGEKEW